MSVFVKEEWHLCQSVKEAWPLCVNLSERGVASVSVLVKASVKVSDYSNYN